MLKLSRLLDLFKGKRPDEIRKDDLIAKVARLKRLKANPDFKEYISLIEEYIDQCRIQKLRYNFAHAYMVDGHKTFKHTAFLDNDIDFAQRLLSIHDDFIADIEEMQRQDKEKEEEEENA